MPRRTRRQLMLSFAITTGVVVVIGCAGAYYATRWVPAFYRDKLKLKPEQLAAHGVEMERRVLGLHSDIQEKNAWQAVFTDNQINGWLAVDLPKKFPRLLPRHLRDPRVAIDPGEAQLACRYENGNMQTVLSLAVDAYLTEDPNVVAVRIRKARIGAVPGMTKLAIEQISKAAWRSRIRLRWTQLDGDPVALVAVPAQMFEGRQSIELELVQLQQGRVFLRGRTVEADRSASHLSAARGPSWHTGLAQGHASSHPHGEASPAAVIANVQF